MGHSRRRIVWPGVTAHPTAEWLANQLTQAFGWERTLNYLIRDRDACYGCSFGGFVPSAFAIVRHHYVRPGRTAMRSA